MPQYIITPWRDISELIAVRNQLYSIESPTPSDTSSNYAPNDDLRRAAVDTVSIFKLLSFYEGKWNRGSPYIF